VRSRNRRISDAGWAEFIRLLEYKCVDNGSELVKVDPANTTRACSNCGTVKDMPLSVRTYKCAECGLELHRDINASINILNRAVEKDGRAGLARTYKPADIA